nr:hypothetical protein [Tanacetum cinerariifolium]
MSPVKTKKASKCASHTKKNDIKEKKPPKDWIKAEEIALCQAWCDVSENNKKGNSMKAKGFWEVAINYFEKETGSTRGLVPSCCVIFDLEPLSFSFDFFLMLRSLNLFLVCLDRLYHLAILCLDQHAHTLHHLESSLIISPEAWFLRMDL